MPLTAARPAAPPLLPSPPRAPPSSPARRAQQVRPPGTPGWLSKYSGLLFNNNNNGHDHDHDHHPPPLTMEALASSSDSALADFWLSQPLSRRRAITALHQPALVARALQLLDAEPELRASAHGRSQGGGEAETAHVEDEDEEDEDDEGPVLKLYVNSAAAAGSTPEPCLRWRDHLQVSGRGSSITRAFPAPVGVVLTQLCFIDPDIHHPSTHSSNVSSHHRQSPRWYWPPTTARSSCSS